MVLQLLPSATSKSRATRRRTHPLRAGAVDGTPLVPSERTEAGPSLSQVRLSPGSSPTWGSTFPAPRSQMQDSRWQCQRSCLQSKPLSVPCGTNVNSWLVRCPVHKTSVQGLGFHSPPSSSWPESRVGGACQAHGQVGALQRWPHPRFSHCLLAVLGLEGGDNRRKRSLSW